MKKIIAFLLVALIVFSFTSCGPKSFTLNESEMDSLFSFTTDVTEKVRPPVDDIIGVYTLGNGDGSNNQQMRAYVSRYDDKIILQVVDYNTIPMEPTEDMLENISTEYKQEKGLFYQVYVTEERTSAYEAYFSVENGRVKIDLYNTYFFASDRILRSGVKAIGYKDE